MRKGISLFLATALLLAAGPTLAVDGVIEINHAAALAGGITTADTSGYPVTLNRAGSYRLTGNLSTSSKNVTAIEITVDDVAIDLNGFAIGCTFAGLPIAACLPSTGSGVGVTVIDRNRVTVRNGTIREMGGDGVHAGLQSHVQNVGSFDNGGNGIFAEPGSTVSNNLVGDNLGNGISAGSGSTVSGNTAYLNTKAGLSVGFGATVIGNTARENVESGIVTGSGSTVSGNTAYQNGRDGIEVGPGSTVFGNTAYLNTVDGIFALGGSTVHRNTVYSNVLFGLSLISDCSYQENTITNNGSTVSGGVNLGSNVCNGTTTCP